MRRAALRRKLRAVAEGKRDEISIDLADTGLDAASALDEATRKLTCDSVELQRLTAVFRNSGIADAAIARLRERGPAARRQSTRLIGALRMPQAVTWLAPLLASKNRGVSEAAARALGRIGGHRSAETLLVAIRRNGLRRSFMAELARAAPDLFLEAILSGPQHPGVKQGAALAAGLRRRHTAVGPLLAMLLNGSPRERAISCRALGWIGSAAAIPALIAALYDDEWKVRLAATKAIRELHAGAAYFDVNQLLADQNPRVRRMAQVTLQRLLPEVRPLWR